jgi:MFS family permease
MQQAAVAWQVYLLTHSAVALGFIGLFRVLPIVVFSLLGGVVADVVNRRALLLITQTWLLLVSAALALVTATGVITLWMIYLLTGMSAAALAFDNPARQALVPSLVSRERLTNALSLMSTALQMATVVGLSLAGLVIAARGVAAVYVIDVLSFLAVIWALLIINPPPVADAVPRVSWTAAVEGLHFVWRSPIILATMGLDFMATFFSSATSLLPIFARDILHVGSEGYGFLYAAPGAGAVVAGVAVSFYSSAIRAQGRVVLLSVAAYGACTVLFGLSRSFALSLLALAGTGAADTVSMIIRQTIRQVVTPDALRGRMTSVTSVFFMGGPQLGEVEAGLVARAFGAPISVISGGVAALLATGLIGYYARGLRRYRG